MVYPCECNNVLQQFKCDPSVAPRTKLNGMCMATMDKDDHVILTGNCSTSNTNLIDRQYIYPEFLLPLITAYPNFDTKIQAGDGNFRVLQTESPANCKNKLGTNIFRSGFSLNLPNNEIYYTQLQRDGNLITRKSNSREWVWQTCSAQSDMSDEFSLVLNEDNTLSILNSKGGEIWNSATGETCYADRPLVLMRSAPGGYDKLEYKNPLKVPNPLTDSDICLVQQGDGNFLVLRGGCDNNSGTLLFRSGFSLNLPNNEKYYTRLQRDGNLVTRKSSSRKWVWQTCSAQGGANDDFSLVVSKDDMLSILDKNGDPIWNSATDLVCFA